MDFSFTPEQEALRQEFEEFFREQEKQAPEGYTAKIDYCYEHDKMWQFHREMAGKLGEKGWLSLPWPEKYGGKGLGQIEQMIFQETRAYHRLPGFDPGPVVAAAGVLEKGTEEQKRKWLPLIGSGSSTWCEGWSEPNSGSDLASITATTGYEDGDDWVINGQKVWTTGAHRCSHMILLARTDPEAPKHRAITYFLTPIDRPGIEVRPILRMYRGHSFNEVFFDDFRVPKENIIGEVHGGWYVLMAGMDFERTGVAFVAETRRDFDELVDLIKENGYDGRSPAEEAVVRHKLAQCQIELETWRQWAYWVAWLQSKGAHVPGESSAVKRFGSELMVKVSQIGLEVLGMYGPLKEGSKRARLYGRFAYASEHDLGMTIAGGTTEIQKNIIAWMELGLPRK
ncbi:MAG: acyl-CoA dehydrogenase family protein [Dehalococcoidia bacterium]